MLMNASWMLAIVLLQTVIILLALSSALVKMVILAMVLSVKVSTVYKYFYLLVKMCSSYYQKCTLCSFYLLYFWCSIYFFRYQ